MECVAKIAGIAVLARERPVLRRARTYLAADLPDPESPVKRLVDRHAGDQVERLRFSLHAVAANGFIVVAATALMRSHHLISGWTFVLTLMLDPILIAALCIVSGMVIDRIGRHVVGTLIASNAELRPSTLSAQETLVTQDRFAAAEASYRDLIAAEPANVLARIQLTDLLARQQRWSEAEALYTDARRQHPDATQETTIGNALIDLYRAAGARDRLKAELSRFARLHPATAAGHYARRHLRELVLEDEQRATSG